MGVFFVLFFSAAVLFLGTHRGHCEEIVGGQESVPHSRPYMAAIVQGNEIYCGGTLVLENWVLTAAHCEINIGDRVILGAHSLTKYEEEKQEFQVIKIIRSPNYNPYTVEHDIMLLQLNGSARINRNVQTVPLPTTDEDVRPGTLCLAVGWGKTHTGLLSDVLQEINTTIIDRNVCKYYYYYEIPLNQLCARVLNKTGGVCNGDSGGPLICGGVQRGIASFTKSRNCNVRVAPDVFAHLTIAHVQWIKDNIQK